MTRDEIYRELRKRNWRQDDKTGAWNRPGYKRLHQGLSLREAASIEQFDSNEDLTEKFHEMEMVLSVKVRVKIHEDVIPSPKIEQEFVVGVEKGLHLVDRSFIREAVQVKLTKFVGVS